MAGTRALRVNTVELRRRPGHERRLDAEVTGAGLGVDDARLTAPIEVRLLVNSTVDGLVVTGTVGVEWTDECRRCLIAVDRHLTSEVDELYQDVVDPDPEAFELGPDVLDLTPMVRDTIALVLADPPPLCRVDCAGICPVCGADRNQESCGCDTAVRDERWAALDDLDVPDA